MADDFDDISVIAVEQVRNFPCCFLRQVLVEIGGDFSAARFETESIAGKRLSEDRNRESIWSVQRKNESR